MVQKRKIPSWLVDEVDTDTASDSAKDNILSKKAHTLNAGKLNDEIEQVKSGDGKEIDQDDYMNMMFSDSTTRGVSKKAATSLAAVDSAINKETPAMKMMQKMGYTTGQALGKQGTGLLEPLEAHFRGTADRQGLGIPIVSKTGAAAEAQSSLTKHESSNQKQSEQEQSQFRETVRTEAEEKRVEGQIHALQKVCENLELRNVDDQNLTPDPRNVNVVWRSLLVERREKLRTKQLRQQMLDSSLSFSNREYNDDGPQHELSATPASVFRRIVEADGEDVDDDELELFKQENAEVRLNRTLSYLRTKFNYCFWCGCEYIDAEDLSQNCPGTTEDDHN